MATVGPAPQGTRAAPGVTPRPLVIVGGGEHAAVVADAVRTRRDAWSLAGFTDPAPSAGAADALGVDHLGDDGALIDRLATLDPDDRPALILGFGAVDAIEARRALAARLTGRGASWATVVHAAAWVSPRATVAEGAVVLAGAVVNAGASVGPHAIVNSGAVVEHDVTVGAFAHVGPRAAIGGGARIGDGAFVGLGASVRDHITIGAGAVVGMGAVVVGAVEAGTTVAGNPARPLDAHAR